MEQIAHQTYRLRYLEFLKLQNVSLNNSELEEIRTLREGAGIRPQGSDVGCGAAVAQPEAVPGELVKCIERLGVGESYDLDGKYLAFRESGGLSL